jgi:hypothetical protein
VSLKIETASFPFESQWDRVRSTNVGPCSCRAPTVQPWKQFKATTQHGRGTALHVWNEIPPSCDGLWATSKRTLRSTSAGYRTDLHGGCYHNAYQSPYELQLMFGKTNYAYKQVYYQLHAPILEIQTQAYTFRPPSVAILREKQYSKTCTAFLCVLSILNGKI